MCVLLDGRVLGEVGQSDVADLALKLRILKALGKENVCMNVAYVGYHTHRIGCAWQIKSLCSCVRFPLLWR